MLGRFVNHEGIQQNEPSARFGNISVMPRRIKQSDGFEQISYAVEMRSMPGYSGSPVFVTRFEQLERDNKWSHFKHMTWLLGINWGHITDHWELKSLIIHATNDSRWGEREKLYVVANTGMNGVIPASRLSLLLHTAEMETYYSEMDRQFSVQEGLGRGGAEFEAADQQAIQPTSSDHL